MPAGVRARTRQERGAATAELALLLQVPAADAIALHKEAGVTLVDVRERGELEADGTIAVLAEAGDGAQALAALDDLWQQTQAGRGGLVLLEAESGGGKTRLLVGNDQGVFTGVDDGTANLLPLPPLDGRIQLKDGQRLIGLGNPVTKAAASGARTIVAVEPAPDNIECLRRNFADEIRAGRVIVYPKGAWDKESTLRLHRVKGNSGGNSVVLDKIGRAHV